MDRLAPEVFLAPYPDPIRDAAEHLRAIVLRTVPNAIEAVRPGWHLIGYSVPIGKRTAYFDLSPRSRSTSISGSSTGC